MPTPEVSHIGVVQQGGLVEDGAVVSKPFESEDAAYNWVSGQVRDAHGEKVIGDRVPNTEIWILTTPGGPTQGWVLPTENI